VDVSFTVCEPDFYLFPSLLLTVEAVAPVAIHACLMHVLMAVVAEILSSGCREVQSTAVAVFQSKTNLQTSKQNSEPQEIRLFSIWHGNVTANPSLHISNFRTSNVNGKKKGGGAISASPILRKS